MCAKGTHIRQINHGKERKLPSAIWVLRVAFRHVSCWGGSNT